MGWRRPLLGLDPAPAVREPERGALVAAVGDELQPLPVGDQPIGEPVGLEPLLVAGQLVVEAETGLGGVTLVPDLDQATGDVHPTHRSGRSEEHTSELQSLLRISYAVFCLKKKN